MPEIVLRVTNHLSWKKELQDRLQRAVNRLCVGEIRYGQPKAEQDYLKRARKALDGYQKTGNWEFLLDAQNYCLLETLAPLHPDFHFKADDSCGRRQKA